MCLNNCLKNLRSTDGQTKKKPNLVERKYRKIVMFATFVLWCAINLIFVYRVATMPETWIFESSFNPLVAFLTYNLVLVVAFSLQYYFWGNPETHEYRIYRDGTVREYKIYDYGFFEWSSKRLEWKNEE